MVKYSVNPSFSYYELSDSKMLVSCNDYLKQFECDLDELKEILEIIDKHHDLKHLVERFKVEYEEKEIKEFVDALVKEEVLLEESDDTEVANIAVIGDRENIEFLNKRRYENIRLVFFENDDSFWDVKEKFDGVLLLPGNITYGEITSINRKLVKKEIPFAIVRFNGERFVVGPIVFPWKTPCLECHIQEHIIILNKEIDESIAIDDVAGLAYAVAWDGSFSDEEKGSFLEIAIQDLKSIIKEKTDFELFKKELIFQPRKPHKVLIKNYQAISKCTCCNNMNKHYITDLKKLVVPDIKSPMDGEEIQYSVGGLRSKSFEYTRDLVEKTLKKLDLDIRIEIDERNPFADIIPVYHSTLDMTHKNKTPYFFGEQHSHGKGINAKQAYFSASFEMFERLSARYFGEMELVRGSQKELGNLCADVTDMTKIVDNVNTVYDKYDENKQIDWVWSYSLVDNKPKLIPASLVFLSRNYFEGNFAPIGSSGMSAGATLKDAILQGLFELLEHDAWMICQANAVRTPIISYDGLKNKELKSVIERITDKGFRVISRDYTTNIGIPVIRTWISNPHDYANYAFSGFGASINPEIALERSVTEAVQSRASVHEAEVDEYCSPDMEYLIDARDGLYSLYYFEQKDIKPIGTVKDISKMPSASFKSVDESIGYVIGRIKATIPDADVLFVNMTRKGIGIPVVKVFITKGTQIIGEPLLVTADRLYTFQKDMGYGEKVVGYDELYLAHYPH